MSVTNFNVQSLTLGSGEAVIVEGLSLTIPSDQVTALVGPNGCGKSTLLRGLSRLLEPRGGYDKARKYGFYTAQDSRGRFFTDLGFVVPEDLVKLAGTSFYADISNERIDLFDRDLIVFVGLQFAEGVRAAIEIDPLLKPLKAVKEGRVVYVPANYDDALQFSSVLSIEFALKGNVPELQTALGLKPAATAQATAAATAAK